MLNIIFIIKAFTISFDAYHEAPARFKEETLLQKSDGKPQHIYKTHGRI